MIGFDLGIHTQNRKALFYPTALTNLSKIYFILRFLALQSRYILEPFILSIFKTPLLVISTIYENDQMVKVS